MSFKIKWKVIVCSAILLMMCAPTMAATLFSDNFDSGSLAAWGQQYPSDWSAAGGTAVCDEMAGAYSRAWHDEVLLTSNWSYDVDLKWMQSNMPDNPDFGSFGVYLITGAGAGGGWWVHAQQWGGTVKIISNGDVYDQSATTTASATGDYHLNVTRMGTANNLVITLTGGGAPLTLTTASAPGLGNYTYVGLLDYYGKVAFDNVLVSSPPVSVANITGKVTDADTSAPIEGALVTIGGFSAMTNATGDYSLQTSSGSQSYTVTKSGYSTSSGMVTVVDGTPINFQLSVVTPTLFSDNFDSGSLAEWDFQYPLDWSASGGAAVCNETAGATSRAWHDAALLISNWSYDVDIKWLASNNPGQLDYGFFGAMLITNPSPYGAWWINAVQWNGSVYLVSNGDVYDQTAPVGASPTGDYHLSIIRSGTANHLVITLTGGSEPIVLTTKDAAGLANYTYIGLLTQYSQVAYDNVLVLSPPLGMVNITGTVTDVDTSAPIEGAVVTIGGMSAMTNATGDYELWTKLGSQSYSVVKDSYGRKTGTVEVVEGTPINFQLKSGPPVFYVSTTGSDITGDGSEANPWASIDYADANSLLLPGDTVYVNAGTYDVDTSISTKGGGDGDGFFITGKSKGVTYQADPAGVTIHQTNPYFGEALVRISNWQGADASQPIVFSGFTLLGGSNTANLQLYNARYVEIKNCVIDSTGYEPSITFWVCTASSIRIHNNLIIGDAATNDSRLQGVKWYNNTFVHGATLGNYAMRFVGYQDGYQPGCMGEPGAPLTADRDEFINNIIDSGYSGGLYFQLPEGFTYPLSVIHDYNLLSNNSIPIYGDVLAAHETTNLDAALGVDYHLLAYSPAIDSGMDVGFPFLGLAPDKGAFEFDGVPVASVKLSEIGSKADGTQVVISDTLVATVSSTVFADNSYYVEDPSRANGIKVVGGTVDAGYRVTIAGTLGTESSGERVILDASVLNRTAGALLGALGMNNKALGGGPSSFQPGITGATGTNNIGLLVTVFGRVVSTGTGEFTLDDGSGVNVRVILPIGVAEPTAPFVTVTGISSCEMVGADRARLLKATGAAY
ncbi:MAG: hypothetical protein ACYC64_17445 [Armatimonadota bacterium]